jgi:Na+/melibiose symporter-like transporter
VLLLPLVLILGDGDKAEGFENTMILFSVIGVVFFLITFFTTRERIVPAEGQHSSILEDIGDLVRNRPWLIMLIATIMVFTTLALKGGTYVYYFEWYAREVALSAFLDNIGFNALIANVNEFLTGHGLTRFRWPDDPPTSAFSLFNGCGIILMIIGIGFSRGLADRFGKRNVFGGALFLSTIPLLAFYIYPPDAIGVMFVSQILHEFFYGITIPLLWAMTADVADYSEWKNNRRATGIVFSAMIFGLKVGLSMGGALVAGILALHGYEAQAETQNPETINGIKLAVSLYCSTPFLIACAGLFFYEINKKMEHQIETDLSARRG